MDYHVILEEFNKDFYTFITLIFLEEIIVNWQALE